MRAPNYIDSDHVVDPQPAEYATDSLDLAAWLVVKGYSLHRVDATPTSGPRPHTCFAFTRPDEETANGLACAVWDWESGHPYPDIHLSRFLDFKRILYGLTELMVREEVKPPRLEPASSPGLD